MSNYLIGIGGTGAKCAETVVHLAAAGLMPPGDLYVLFVDPDASNGTVGRVQRSLRRYWDNEALDTGSDVLFNTRVRPDEPEVWSPFEQQVDPTLGDAVGYENLRADRPDVANLFDTLYSPGERNANLSVGFRGHPSIGAAVLSQTVSFEDEEPWTTFRTMIENDTSSGNSARIFLCGSVFGGTGAAGLPNVARLIEKELGKIAGGNGQAQDDARSLSELGCALVLPYFSFNFPAGTGEDIRADSSGFIPNTQAALKYYWEHGLADTYDRMYVLGDAAMSPVTRASVGGPEQKNAPHFIDLFAGLAALDFFHQGASSDNARDDVAPISTENQQRLTWRDLPYRDRAQLTGRLGQLARFAFAYLSVYEPALQEVSSSNAYGLPWYVDFFERGPRRVDVQSQRVQSQREAVREYCEYFLEWMAGLHVSARHRDVQLFPWRAFATVEENGDGEEEITLLERFDTRQFASLGARRDDDGHNALDRLWRHMSSNPSTDGATGFAAFIRALYDGCAPRSR